MKGFRDSHFIQLSFDECLNFIVVPSLDVVFVICITLSSLNLTSTHCGKHALIKSECDSKHTQHIRKCWYINTIVASKPKNGLRSENEQKVTISKMRVLGEGNFSLEWEGEYVFQNRGGCSS